MSGEKARNRRRQTAFKLSVSAEGRAALLLAAKRYRELARRWKSPLGEVDLVMRRGKTTVFVEVKARARLDDAAWSVLHRRRGRSMACSAPRTCGI